MKPKYWLVLLFLNLMVIQSHGAKQELLDSVIVSLPGGVTLRLATDDAPRYEQIGAINPVLDIILSQERVIRDALKHPDARVELRYALGGTLEVNNPASDHQVFQVDAAGNQLVPDPPRDRITMDLLGWGTAQLELPGWENLAALRRQNVDSLLVGLSVVMGQEGLLKDKHAALKAHARRENGQWVLDDHSRPADYLEISGGANFGLIRDRLVPDIGIGTYIGLGDKKGDLRHLFGLRLDMHYFFEQSSGENKRYSMDINMFLNAAYNYHFKDRKGVAYTTGGGVGYLINRDGDFFQGETFKFWLNFGKAKSRFRIGSDLYATDDLKVWFPAVRMGLNF
ncbi:MAG: hypothetical protein AAGB22_01725 [Bacteroidota bacterium]